MKERCGACRFFVPDKRGMRVSTGALLGDCSAPVPGWIGHIEDSGVVDENDGAWCQSYAPAEKVESKGP